MAVGQLLAKNKKKKTAQAARPASAGSIVASVTLRRVASVRAPMLRGFDFGAFLRPLGFRIGDFDPDALRLMWAL